MHTRDTQQYHHKKPSFWSILFDNLAFVIVVGLVLFCLQFAASVKAQTPDLARAGEMFLVSKQQRVTPALQLNTNVSMSIEGMTSRVSVQQAFTNNSSEWQEGVYVFPLPDDSAVNAMSIRLGEREIVGEIHEREEAREIYQKSRDAGQQAALVEQQRPNLFTQKVANIAPGETVTVELQYIQAVRYENGRFSLRFPMTITPRYIPGVPLGEMEAQQEFVTSNKGWADPTAIVPDAAEITPPYLSLHLQNRINLDITLDAGMEVDSLRSPSHRLDILESLQQDNLFHMNLEGGSAAMDRDFELEWQPRAGQVPQAATFVDSVEGNTYLQVMLMPPQVQASSAALNREVVIVMDTSGSMAGASIAQAKRSVEFALSRLQANDRFNVVEFNSDFHPLFPESVNASAANVMRALNFVRSLNADGGTEMYPALQWALATRNTDTDGMLKQLVFITDGSVGNEEQMFTLIRNDLKAARLFTVGIGAAPNSYFMRKAAELGRGTYTFISDLDEVASSMDALFSKLGNAVMAGVQLTWPAGTEVEYYPTAIPDLYLGEPLFVTAKITGKVASAFDVGISGQLQGKAWERNLNVTMTEPAAQKTTVTSALASYWARQKIAALTDLLQTGTGIEEVKAQVLAIALPFQLMSRFSSFVAVERIVARTQDAALFSSKVGNQPPAGQLLAARMAGQNLQSQQLVYPGTATPAALNLLAGLIALGIALCSSRWSRKQLFSINYLRVDRPARDIE
ncbi:MAG: marine proteobacterial sortase target protein [Pseudomonadota bacterium]